MTDLISSIGDCQAEPRLLLASTTGNFPSSNLFDLPRYRIWAQWTKTGRPDDVEDFYDLAKMDGLHLTLADDIFRGKPRGFDAVAEMLCLHLWQLHFACQTRPDQIGVPYQVRGITEMLGTSLRPSLR